MSATHGEIHMVVDPQDGGQRLDTFLSMRWPGCSRSQAAGWIRGHMVHVDGTPRKPSYRVQPGEIISGFIPAPIDSELVPQSIPISILYEDHDVIVVDKPPGLVVHPAAGHAKGTLVNALLHYCTDLQGIGGERRPGIVHRLDKDTSGVMVVAKNDRAQRILAQDFKERRVEKNYLAIVFGSPDQSEGRIDLPVGRHPVERKKMSVISTRGREAVTLWHLRERFKGAALLSLELKTGRTHQIRVHCQSMGHPIIGDPIYGPKKGLQRAVKIGDDLYAVFRQAQRQMLHAQRIGFIHPVRERHLTFEAPIPDDMSMVLKALRGLSKTTGCPNP